MILGAFGLVADYDAMCAAGYDYAELDLPELEAMSEEDFAVFAARVEQSSFKVRLGSRILPLTEPTFFRPGFKVSSLEPYLQSSCRRAARLGISRVILGNGKARMLPDPADRSQDQIFIDLLTMMSETAGACGLELILEPLGPRYSNYLNTLAEAAEITAKVRADNLFLMADFRHMVWSEEPLSDLATFRELIHHVHVDYPHSFPERDYPRPDDGCDYGPFIRALQQSGYDDTLTIEADRPHDWKSAHDAAVQVLQPLF